MYREKSHICTSKLIESIHTSATMLSSVSSICQMYRHLMWVYFTSSQDSIRGWRRIGGGGGMEAAGMAGSWVAVGPFCVVANFFGSATGFAVSGCCLGWITDWEGSRTNCMQQKKAICCFQRNSHLLRCDHSSINTTWGPAACINCKLKVQNFSLWIIWFSPAQPSIQLQYTTLTENQKCSDHTSS